MLYEKLTIPINLPRPYNNEINIEYPHIALIKQLLNSSKTNETSIINLFNNYFLEKVSLKIKNIYGKLDFNFYKKHCSNYFKIK